MPNYLTKQEISQGQRGLLFIKAKNYIIAKYGRTVSYSSLESLTNKLIRKLLIKYNNQYATSFNHDFEIDNQCLSRLLEFLKTKTESIALKQIKQK